MDIGKKIKSLRNKILKLSKKHGAKNVRVFGSVAKGTAKSVSDLDILIELESGRSLLDIIALKQDLEDLLDCNVDVVTEGAVSPYIKQEILKTAVNL